MRISFFMFLLVLTALFTGSHKSSASPPVRELEKASNVVQYEIQQARQKLERESVSFQARERTRRLFDLLIEQNYEELQKELLKDSGKTIPWSGNTRFYWHARHWAEMNIPQIEVISALNGWVDAFPDSAIPYIMRAKMYHKYAWQVRGRAFTDATPPEALADFRRLLETGMKDIPEALSREPENAAILSTLIDYSFLLSGRESGENALELAQTHNPDSYPVLRAYSNYKGSRYFGTRGERVRFARGYAQKYPDNPLYKLLLLEAHEETGSRFEYIGDVTERGQYYARPEVWRELTQLVGDIERQRPSLIEAYYTYARMAQYAGKDEAKYKYYSKIQEYDPFYAGNSLWYKAKQFYREKQYDKAKDAFVKHLALSPQEGSSYRYVGYIYARQGEHLKATVYYLESLKYDPKGLFAYINICASGQRIFPVEEIMPFCQMAVELHPGDYWVYEKRAYAWDKMGEHEKAREDRILAKELKKSGQ